MAGLLDLLSSGDPGLLTALSIMSAGRAQPQRQSLAEGLLGGMQVGQQAKQAQDEAAMKKLLMQAQIGDMQAQQQQRAAQAQELQRKAAEAARQQQLLQQAFGGVTGTQANAVSGITGPRPEALGVVGQQQQPNYQQLIAQGLSPDLVKALAESRNYGQNKVARVEDTMVDGRPVKRQFDEFGRPVGEALPQWKAPVMSDQGGVVNAVDPVTLASLAQFKKTMSPDAQASNALGWANYGLAKQKDARDAQQAKGQYDPERGLLIDPRTGQAVPVTQNGQPIGPKNKDMTDSQAKALLFGQRAKEADSMLGKLATAGTIRPSIIKQGVEGIPGVGGALGAAANAFVATPNQQSVEQAQRDFLNAVLRRESGAVISDNEFANAKQQYFPQVGDSPQVIAQKAQNRRLATELILREVPAAQRGGAPSAGGQPSLDDLLKKYGG